MGKQGRHFGERRSRRTLHRARREGHRLDLQRKSPERPARNGGGFRRHRAGAQCLPLCRRYQQAAAEHRRRRDHPGPHRLHDRREGQARRRHSRADRQRAARPQRRAHLDEHLAAGALFDSDADRQVFGRFAQDRIRGRTQPAQRRDEAHPSRRHGDRRADRCGQRERSRTDRGSRRAHSHVARNFRDVQTRRRTVLAAQGHELDLQGGARLYHGRRRPRAHRRRR